MVFIKQVFAILQVLQSVRTGLTLHGRQGIAMCLDDLSGKLSNSPTIVREAVKASKAGASHVARDFVPKGSKNCAIKRGANSLSRKCTVIWMDTLPERLCLSANDGKKIGVDTIETSHKMLCLQLH